MYTITANACGFYRFYNIDIIDLIELNYGILSGKKTLFTVRTLKIITNSQQQKQQKKIEPELNECVCVWM